MDLAERLRRFEASDLYVVITEAFCAGRSAIEVLEGVLAAGVTLIQLREKDLSDRELFDLAVAFRERTRAADALLIVDDRLDVALAVDADGVHLGEHDLPIETARRIAPDLIVGASSHNYDEAMRNQAAGAGYVNIGPIFATQTKGLPIEPLGPDAIARIVPDLRIPFTCMGGIKPENIDQVLERGARHPAVVTAVTAQPNVAKAAKDLRDKVLAYTGNAESRR